MHQNAVSSVHLKENRMSKSFLHHLHVVGSSCKFLSCQLSFWKYKHFHESENIHQNGIHKNEFCSYFMNEVHCTVLVREVELCVSCAVIWRIQSKANPFLPTQQMKPTVINNQEAHNTKKSDTIQKTAGFEWKWETLGCNPQRTLCHLWLTAHYFPWKTSAVLKRHNWMAVSCREDLLMK